ncbi:MAG: hypothetical protein ACRBB0_10535 [Pelagimonas sp.]|uniref:hypothetical protein n=1 Tax=Pelagimonas sp. TaxID=2073170 RepID=UPI003D6BE639
MADLTVMSVKISDIYAQRFETPNDARFAVMKLSEEMGELMGAWLQYHGESRGSGTHDDLANEIADVFGFLLVLAAREGVNPANALMTKWGRYLPQET